MQRTRTNEVESLEIEDFKSIGSKQRVEFGPLTLLAGANSSGKSTLMQPILLLKQTLDSPFDPGPLRLSGPNVNVSSTAQLLSKVPDAGKDGFKFRFGLTGGGHFQLRFSHAGGRGVDVESMEIKLAEGLLSRLTPGMHSKEIWETIPTTLRRELQKFQVEVSRYRCFLDVHFRKKESKVDPYLTLSQIYGFQVPIQRLASRFMHLPGLRGTPERTYEVTALATEYAGTFEKYAASIIHNWQRSGDQTRLAQLNQHLSSLGLTWKVRAEPVQETRVELLVGRLPRPIQGGARDLVSIADVGVGVSQALPIAVALVAAEVGDWIYVEQPEIHLHPRAQAELGPLFADAARRGVHVVVETHSPILLRTIQTLVAEGKMDEGDVRMHWCTRDRKTGATRVELAGLKADGSFGDWPEDFAEVEMEVERKYLDAASKRKR